MAHSWQCDVLRERGPKTFSLEEVARRAGCSRATVYRFVGNKRSLVDTLVGLAATTVVEQVRTQTRGMQGKQLVIESILAGVQAIRSDRTLAEFVKSPPAFDDTYFTHSEMLNRLAASLMDLGEEHDLGAEWLIRVVLSMITWPVDDPTTERELIERYVGAAF
jgi:AcrR family transcriptional regulator